MNFRLWVGRIGAAWALMAVGMGMRAQQPLKVQKHRLANGLTVLALEDHTTPSIAYYTVFKVGSRNERSGHYGPVAPV